MSQATTKPPVYKYQPLPTERHTRRLILAPGKGEDPLRGDLETISLEDPLTPYEAISYVWGSDNKYDVIMITGGSTIHITPNLAEVLRQARLPNVSRALWADSVCIDQVNDKEKGQQVAFMGEIYKRSKCTLICLGLKGERRARDVAALISDFNRRIQAIFDDPEFSWDWNSFPWPNNDDPLISNRRWESWVVLATQPWFRRGWVVQESTLGSNVYVLWAGVKMEWISVLRALYWIDCRANHLIPTWYPGMLVVVYNRIFELQRPNEAKTLSGSGSGIRRPAFWPLSTLSILGYARQMGLSNPKDRIYAFMALPTTDGIMSTCALKPDYREKTSHLDVYRDFAVKYLEKTSDLNLLCFVDHRGDGGEDDDANDDDDSLKHFGETPLSSWVPRWDRGCNPRNTFFSHTVRKIQADLQQFAVVDAGGGLALRVRAVIFDSVAWAAEDTRYISPDNVLERTKQVVKLWREAAKQSAKYPGPHRTPRCQALAFLFALCAGTYTGELQTWRQSQRVFAQLLESDYPDRPMDAFAGHGDTERISTFISTHWSQRRLVLLGRGYYGLASTLAGGGDVCAIIFGTASPFILRKIPGERNRYKVVGPACVESKVCDSYGCPRWLGGDECWEDWREWGLPSEDIVLC